MEETSDQDCPLDHNGREEQVVTDATEAIALQERHQEAEADEDHHVHILEHCETQREFDRCARFHRRVSDTSPTGEVGEIFNDKREVLLGPSCLYGQVKLIL